MRRQDMKPFAWGMTVGAIVLLIVIFSAGWVVTSTSAEAQAKKTSAEAVIDRLAPISVAQYQADPNREARVKEMKALEPWKRSEFVMAQGWAKMPGEKESDSGVARACARLIEKLNNM
jgi:heme A synthase